MLQFDAIIHAAAAGCKAGPPIQLAGRSYATTDLCPGGTAEPLPLSFDQATEALERLDRMLLEPDGSFVVSGGSGAERWQIDGLLHDRGDRLAKVELHGRCPEATFDRLLAAIAGQNATLMFELRRVGVYLGEPEFRRYAADEAATT
jgi:hypothetical protein